MLEEIALEKLNSVRFLDLDLVFRELKVLELQIVLLLDF